MSKLGPSSESGIRVADWEPQSKNPSKSERRTHLFVFDSVTYLKTCRTSAFFHVTMNIHFYISSLILHVTWSCEVIELLLMKAEMDHWTCRRPCARCNSHVFWSTNRVALDEGSNGSLNCDISWSATLQHISVRLCEQNSLSPSLWIMESKGRGRFS